MPGPPEQKLDRQRLRQARRTRHDAAAGLNQIGEPFHRHRNECGRTRRGWNAGAQLSTKRREWQQPQPQTNGREQENNPCREPSIGSAEAQETPDHWREFSHADRADSSVALEGPRPFGIDGTDIEIAIETGRRTECRSHCLPDLLCRRIIGGKRKY